jgi:hypothetical protein
MKAKLINGENSWRLEVDGSTYYFTNSSFADFLSDLLSMAGYKVEFNDTEYVTGIDTAGSGKPYGYTVETSI